MLAIRMQRTGRKGHAQFRVIVQDSHRSPSGGKVVEYLGSYNPHTKEVVLKKEIIEKYLSNGAQPSNRAAILFKKEGVKLPKWVKIDTSQKRNLKNPDKLRKNRPDEPKEKAPAEEPAVELETKEEEQASVAKEAEEKEVPVEEPKEEKAIAAKDKEELSEATEGKDTSKNEEKADKPK